MLVSSLPSLLSDRIQAVAGVDPELRPATKPQFGHYQSNVALRLAKSEGRPPREVAADIVARLEIDDLCEPPEIAGPGFINLRLKTDVLAGAVNDLLADPHTGIEQTEQPQIVVIDYSAPNVAKQMHVGHLRTTIIGDCFNRVLTAVGHRSFRRTTSATGAPSSGCSSRRRWTRRSTRRSCRCLRPRISTSAVRHTSVRIRDFADRARRRVVALQSGDEQTRRIWRDLVAISLVGFNATYDRLNVKLTDDDLAGESTYNDDLASVAAELEADGTGVIDQGALVVFVEGFNAPMIVRKSDGGYGYSITDLAAVRHRVRDLHANRLIYVTDVRQGDHFAQVFAVARLAGWLPGDVEAEHVGYGMVLGPDGKPYKTRDGKAMLLADLLDMAEEKAAPAIALAAIKYADLSNGLNKDYVFDVDRMVQTTGNTGPYLQYAHARMAQVLRRAEAEGLGSPDKIIVLEQPAEQTLSLLLSRYGEVVAEVADSLQPHKLCAYLYDVAGALSIFYEQCPVLKSDGVVRDSRLALCLATKRVLATGLDLLGIEALDRM